MQNDLQMIRLETSKGQEVLVGPFSVRGCEQWIARYRDVFDVLEPMPYCANPADAADFVLDGQPVTAEEHEQAFVDHINSPPDPPKSQGSDSARAREFFNTPVGDCCDAMPPSFSVTGEAKPCADAEPCAADLHGGGYIDFAANGERVRVVEIFTEPGRDNHPYMGHTEGADLRRRALDLIVEYQFVHLGRKSTVCVARMSNGFECSGYAAPINKNHFDAKLGRRIAKQKAVDNVMKHIAYQLHGS